MSTIHRTLSILFILALLLSIPLVVTAQGRLQLTQTNQQRCCIIGIGYFHREHEDKIWVNYFEPYCVFYHGQLVGPEYIGFTLTFHHFVGFIIPINHCITPIFGRIDYDPILLC